MKMTIFEYIKNEMTIEEFIHLVSYFDDDILAYSNYGILDYIKVLMTHKHKFYENNITEDYRKILEEQIEVKKYDT